MDGTMYLPLSSTYLMVRSNLSYTKIGIILPWVEYHKVWEIISVGWSNSLVRVEVKWVQDVKVFFLWRSLRLSTNILYKLKLTAKVAQNKVKLPTLILLEKIINVVHVNFN